MNKEKIIDFIKKDEIYAITMPVDMVMKSELALQLQSHGVYVYAHTINDKHIYENVRTYGAAGIYTDFLLKLTSKFLSCFKSNMTGFSLDT